VTEYHIHDKGPGPWLQRLFGVWFRYTICEGSADPTEHWLHCHVFDVAVTRRGVVRATRKQRRQRRQPFYKYPAEEVRP
jgi:hypothetical protein